MIFVKIPNVRGETRVRVFWAEGTAHAESGGSEKLGLKVLSTDNMRSSGSIMSKGWGLPKIRVERTWGQSTKSHGVCGPSFIPGTAGHSCMALSKEVM